MSWFSDELSSHSSFKRASRITAHEPQRMAQRLLEHGRKEPSMRTVSLLVMLSIAGCVSPEGDPTQSRQESTSLDDGSNNPCSDVTCPSGQHCTAPADAPYCVADTPAHDPCNGVTCPSGQHCTAPADVPYCEADPSAHDPCGGVTCPSGQHCTAPADVPYCEADPSEHDPCSGVTCPSGQHCTAPADVPYCVAKAQ